MGVNRDEGCLLHKPSERSGELETEIFMGKVEYIATYVLGAKLLSGCAWVCGGCGKCVGKLSLCLQLNGFLRKWEMEVGWVGRNEKIPVRKKKWFFFPLEQGELLADLKFQDLCVLQTQKA